MAPGRSQGGLQALEFGVGLQEDFSYLCTFSDVSNTGILISAVFKSVFVDVLTSAVAVLKQT
jgi:enterochelin esterase-like enzyme